MNRWNAYMARKFKGEVLVGTKDDPHRQRTIRVYEIPGDDEHYGLTDGVDSWICLRSAVVNIQHNTQHDQEDSGEEVRPRPIKKKTVRIPLAP